MDRKVTLVLLLPLLLGWHWLDPAARRNAAGLDAYRQGKFGEALQKFLSARGIRPEATTLQRNTAAALYQLEKFKEALAEFSRIDPGSRGVSRRDFHYNMGNTHFRLEQFDKALDHYKQALIRDPGDMDIKRNFELTLRRLEQQKQQSPDSRPSPQQNQPDSGRNGPQDRPPEAEKGKAQLPQEKYRNLLQYLAQKEKEQLKERKRQVPREARREKDW